MKTDDDLAPRRCWVVQKEAAGDIARLLAVNLARLATLPTILL
jgi:hypothetical protein